MRKRLKILNKPDVVDDLTSIVKDPGAYNDSQKLLAIAAALLLLLSACTPQQNVDADGYLMNGSTTKNGLIITPNDPTKPEFVRYPKCCRSLTADERAEIEAMNERNWAKQRAESKAWMKDRKKKGLVTYEPDSTITVNIE